MSLHRRVVLPPFVEDCSTPYLSEGFLFEGGSPIFSQEARQNDESLCSSPPLKSSAPGQALPDHGPEGVADQRPYAHRLRCEARWSSSGAVQMGAGGVLKKWRTPGLLAFALKGCEKEASRFRGPPPPCFITFSETPSRSVLMATTSLRLHSPQVEVKKSCRTTPSSQHSTEQACPPPPLPA